MISEEETHTEQHICTHDSYVLHASLSYDDHSPFPEAAEAILDWSGPLEVAGPMWALGHSE